MILGRLQGLIELLRMGTMAGILMLGVAIGDGTGWAQDRPETGRRGFWCDASATLPMTRYQNANGEVETWFVWGSRASQRLGLSPLERCQTVSRRFEVQRREGKLRYIIVTEQEGLRAVCSARSDGQCDSLLLTLNPNQDLVAVIGQLLALREGIKGIPPIQM